MQLLDFFTVQLCRQLGETPVPLCWPALQALFATHQSIPCMETACLFGCSCWVWPLPLSLMSPYVLFCVYGTSLNVLCDCVKAESQFERCWHSDAKAHPQRSWQWCWVVWYTVAAHQCLSHVKSSYGCWVMAANTSESNVRKIRCECSSWLWTILWTHSSCLCLRAYMTTAATKDRLSQRKWDQ